MTKAELIAAILDAPDNATVCIDHRGVLRTKVAVEYADKTEIVLSFEFDPGENEPSEVDEPE